jgi:hypothetical protein
MSSSSSSPLNSQQKHQSSSVDLPLTSRSQTRSSKSSSASVVVSASTQQTRANHLKRKKNHHQVHTQLPKEAAEGEEEDYDSDKYSSSDDQSPKFDKTTLPQNSQSQSTRRATRRLVRHDTNGNNITVKAKKEPSAVITSEALDTNNDVDDSRDNSNSCSTALSGTSCEQIQTRSSLLRARLQQTDLAAVTASSSSAKKHSVTKSSSNTSSSSSSLFKKKKMMKKSEAVSVTAAATSKATPPSSRIHNENKSQSTQIEQFEQDNEASGEDDKSNQQWLDMFSRWSGKRQLSALDQLLEACSWQCIKHVHSYIEPKMQRDYISELPRELCLLMLTYVRPRDLYKLAQVSRYWHEAANDPILWKNMCKTGRVNIGVESSDATTTTTSATDSELMMLATEGTVNSPRTSTSAATISPSYSYLYTAFNPYKRAYYIDYNVAKNWCSRPIPPHTSLRAHDDHVITCLKFDGYRILSGSDDNTLKVWCARTGNLLHTLSGHTVSALLLKHSALTIINENIATTHTKCSSAHQKKRILLSDTQKFYKKKKL